MSPDDSPYVLDSGQSTQATPKRTSTPPDTIAENDLRSADETRPTPSSPAMNTFNGVSHDAAAAEAAEPQGESPLPLPAAAAAAAPATVTSTTTQQQQHDTTPRRHRNQRPSAKQRVLEHGAAANRRRVFELPSLRRQMDIVSTRLHDDDAVPTPGPTATRVLDVRDADAAHIDGHHQQQLFHHVHPYAVNQTFGTRQRSLPGVANHQPRIVHLVDKRRKLSPLREDRQRALLAYAKTPEPIPVTKYDELMSASPLTPVRDSLQLNPLLRAETMHNPPTRLVEMALTPEPSITRFLGELDEASGRYRDAKPVALLRVSKLHVPVDHEAPLKNYYRLRQEELKESGPSATTAAGAFLQYAKAKLAAVRSRPSATTGPLKGPAGASTSPPPAKRTQPPVTFTTDVRCSPQRKSSPPPEPTSTPREEEVAAAPAAASSTVPLAPAAAGPYQPQYVPPNRRRLAPIHAPLVHFNGSSAVPLLKQNPAVRQTAVALQEALRALPRKAHRTDAAPKVDPVAQLIAAIPAALRNRMHHLPASETQVCQQQAAEAKMRRFRKETERRIAARDEELEVLVHETAEILVFEKQQRFKKLHAKNPPPPPPSDYATAA